MPRGRDQGACGGTPKRDGSGRGVGNQGTPRQPKYHPYNRGTAQPRKKK